MPSDGLTLLPARRSLTADDFLVELQRGPPPGRDHAGHAGLQAVPGARLVLTLSGSQRQGLVRAPAGACGWTAAWCT
jgi:hypothetical protein